MSKMHSYYPDIGERPDGYGVKYFLAVPTVYDMPLVDIAAMLKRYMKLDWYNNFSLIRTLRDNMRKGAARLYINETIIVKPVKNRYQVIEGNHRILALILLGEKYLYVNKVMTYINKRSEYGKKPD